MGSNHDAWTLHPTADQLWNTIDSLNVGLLARSEAGHILFANERLLDWLGYSPNELDGQHVSILLPKELRGAIDEEMGEIADGDERARVGVLRAKTGRTRPIVWFPHVLRSDEGIVAIVAVVMDLGEVQTAKRVGTEKTSGLSDSLERIANELQTISLFAGSGPIPTTAADHPELGSLSAREREILIELIGGLRVSGIAKKLFISPHTVRNHLKSIYRKLDVASQSELLDRVRALTDDRGEAESD